MLVEKKQIKAREQNETRGDVCSDDFLELSAILRKTTNLHLNCQLANHYTFDVACSQGRTQEFFKRGAEILRKIFCSH